jgi:hypothetical protein
MTLPIPVIGQLIDSVGNVVNSGFGILGDLVRGHMDRQERKLALEELKIKAEEARKNLELEVNLDIKTREANLKILQGMMEIIQDVIRTDVELKLLAQATNAKLSLLIMDWQKSAVQEFVRLKDEVLTNLSRHLMTSQSLPELERGRFISLAYENYDRSTEMIFETDANARKQAETLASLVKPIDTKLQETLSRLAGMDTLKLLDEYPEDGDR